MGAITVMRNRVSTEFKKVEKDSDEYLELQAQRDPKDGRPVWEETGIHDAVEQSKRLEEGRARPWDVGDEHQPVAVIRGTAVGAQPASEVREPLPSERAAGAEQEEGPLFGVGNPVDTEVPLQASMEEPTDTDVSGTDEEVASQIEEAREESGGGGEDREGTGSSGKAKRRSSRKKDDDSSSSSSAEQSFDEEQQKKS